ncbi:cell envelope integrity protein TolA [Xanthomonadaceae bacterium JHOS43]|nr:cell envelope integrity protein TolA [Xanthomonadaceae bacterium JHOS43]MCX7562815.1 cell envelope integrity protein TolA [Xanthomonadaceae bacterium XH05]
METTADKLRAVGLALGLHVLLVGLLYVGLLFQRERAPLSVAGGSIEAVLTETLSPPAATPPPRPPVRPQQEEAAPPPQPRPEPKPQDAPEPPQPTPQAPVTRPDSVDQEKVLREAAEKAENARREQEERRRQEQVLLEEQRQKEEAERRQRLAQQQAEREKQLADIRRQREEAEKRRRLEEEKLKQLADQRQQAAAQTQASAPSTSTAPPSDRLGNQGTDDGLLGRYQLAIQQQVDRNWLRPDNLRPGLRCHVAVTQMVGGQVTGVDFSRCPADELTRRSIEASLMREPLPYRGYESVFERRLNIPFCYPLEVCAR